MLGYIAALLFHHRLHTPGDQHGHRRRCQASKVPGVTTLWSRRRRGQQPGHGGDHGAVGPVRPGTGNLAAQGGDLMPEHQDLGVLGGVASGEEGEPAEQLDHEQADKADEHDRRRDGRGQALARVLAWHRFSARTAAQRPRSRPT